MELINTSDEVFVTTFHSTQHGLAGVNLATAAGHNERSIRTFWYFRSIPVVGRSGIFILIQSTSINQFNSNLAAREPDSK